jgi:hypothetical protein
MDKHIGTHQINPATRRCVHCGSTDTLIIDTASLECRACPEYRKQLERAKELELEYKERRNKIYDEIIEKENQVLKLQLEIANLRKRL